MSDESLNKLKRLVDLHKQAYTPIKEQEEQRKLKEQEKESIKLPKFKR